MNIFIKQIYSTHREDPNNCWQISPLKIRVDLGVMTLKECTLPRYQELEIHHQIQFSHTQGTSFLRVGVIPLRGMRSTYSKSHQDYYVLFMILDNSFLGCIEDFSALEHRRFFNLDEWYLSLSLSIYIYIISTCVDYTIFIFFFYHIYFFCDWDIRTQPFLSSLNPILYFSLCFVPSDESLLVFFVFTSVFFFFLAKASFSPS